LYNVQYIVNNIFLNHFLRDIKKKSTLFVYKIFCTHGRRTFSLYGSIYGFNGSTTQVYIGNTAKEVDISSSILTLTGGTVGGQASCAGITGTVGDGGRGPPTGGAGLRAVQRDGLVSEGQLGPPAHTSAHPTARARG
jgi:hypothetical protein